jgi:transcriptional regulator with XRE-family HTH domain
MSSPNEGCEAMPTTTKPPERETLAEYVRRVRNEKNLSLRDVERNSRRAGLKIVGSYVSRIENEIATNPSKDKLVALAAGLVVQEDEVFAKARGKSLQDPSVREEQMLTLFRGLPSDRQDDLMGMLRHLYSQHAVKELPAAKKKRPRAA